MKKNQLSKLALMGLATGAMITSNVNLSASTVTDNKGTYLAGGCGGPGKCSGSDNRNNPNNKYTADAAAAPANTVVNPNMAPRPDAMQDGTINSIPANGHGNTGTGSCAANKGTGSCASKGTGSCASKGTGSCASKPSNNQGSGSCASQNKGSCASQGRGSCASR